MSRFISSSYFSCRLQVLLRWLSSSCSSLFCIKRPGALHFLISPCLCPAAIRCHQVFGSTHVARSYNALPDLITLLLTLIFTNSQETAKPSAIFLGVFTLFANFQTASGLVSPSLHPSFLLHISLKWGFPDNRVHYICS